MAPEAGGPPVVCAGLAGALTERGHRVTIATIESEAVVGIPEGVELKRFALEGSARYAKSAGLQKWLGENVKRFDVAHLHSLWQFPTFAAARACQRSGVPYFSLLHGMLDVYCVQERSYWIKRLYWMWREKGVQSHAAAVHCLNFAEIRRAVGWIRDMPKVVVGNGIGVGELEGLPARGRFVGAHPHLAGRPVALFLSRLHPKKGLERLIPAWKLMAARMPEAALVIAGSGDATYTALVDEWILRNDLSQHVFRVGQLVGVKKWEALVDADVFVLPSHQEGFSMAITEALAAGLPAVVTEECNFDELEADGGRGACGVIIRNGDMEGFVGAVEELLKDAGRRSAMGEVGRALVRARFTWPQIAGEIEGIYGRAIAKEAFNKSGRL